MVLVRTGRRLRDAHTAQAAVGLAFAGGLAVALFGAQPAKAGSHELTEQKNQVIPVTTESRLHIKNSRGKSFIVGKKGATEVAIRAEKLVRAKNGEAAKAAMEELRFTVDSDGEQLSIVTHYSGQTGEDASFWEFLRGLQCTAQIDYTIEVPSRLEVEVTSTSGDVQVTSIEGRCTVEGSSGDVLLKSIGGSAVVEVSSGDVEVQDVAGDVRVRLSSGDVVIRDAGGSLGLAATSGDVNVWRVTGDTEVELASGDCVIDGANGSVALHIASGDATLVGVLGSVWATGGSGDVTMDILPVGDKEFVVNTSSGDVHVAFATPESYGFALDVSTASGSIEGDLDIRLEKVSRRMLRGVVGNGESRLRIETASGNVIIQRARR